MTHRSDIPGAAFELSTTLGRKLRDLFTAPGSLPRRLTELLEALAAKETKSALPKSDLKNAMLALLPTLRAFAISLCGDYERADDLVQETILKAWSHLD